MKRKLPKPDAWNIIRIKDPYKAINEESRKGATMGKREIIQYFDDLSGVELKDGDVQTVRFSYRGRDYVIDLSEDNATEFDKIMERYIEAGRFDERPAQRAANARRPRGTDNATRNRNRIIRQWAKDNGMDVADRGALAKSVIEAYEAAH